MKNKLIISLISLSLILIPVGSRAESTQQTANSSQLYNSSPSSTFQSASFQQNNSGAVVNTGGNSAILSNSLGSDLTVTDGPRDVVTKKQTKTTNFVLYFLYLILSLSVLGFFATFLNLKNNKTRKIIVQPEEEKETTVKKLKKKRRNKKHHR